MKRLFQFVLTASIVVSAALSCAKENNPVDDNPLNPEENPQEPEEGYVTLHFIAEFENQGEATPAGAPADPETKMSAMDASGNFAWENGDVVKVLYNGGETTATAVVVDNKATFSPTIKEGTEEVWLVYPSNITGVSLSSGKLVVPLPAIQKGSLNGFFVAKAKASDTKAAFCHPVCYYKMDVSGDGGDVTKVEITSASGAILSASALTLDIDGNNRPAVADLADDSSTLTASFNGEGTYYIAVVPNATELAANDLTFQFYRGTGSDEEKAGAYLYNHEVNNLRGNVLDWTTLPTRATNKYVEQDPSGSSKTGSSANPWSS